jgi:hypothetical protein
MPAKLRQLRQYADFLHFIKNLVVSRADGLSAEAAAGMIDGNRRPSSTIAGAGKRVRFHH